MQEMNREVLSKYDIATVAEAMGDVERVMKFVDPARKELDMAYYFEAIDFGYLPNEYKMPDPNGYDLVAWKKVYAKWTDAFAQKGWGTMYLANHDQPRMLTRWGNDSPAFREVSSKMLTTFILSMRGTPFYYFGDEIGMNNIKFDKVEDYNDIELRTNYAQVKAKGGDLNRFLEGMKISSRDNGRTPMQWDATEHGGRVWIRVARQGTHALVEVGDTGHGMSPEFVRERLFKPFQTTKPTGMGIGAYESFQYVHELGGKLSVDSAVDVGTQVALLLPLFDTGHGMKPTETPKESA